MGLILDTSVLIDAERLGLTALSMLDHLNERFSEDIALSAVSVMEFAVGIGRAKQERQRERRQGFLMNLTSTLEVIPLDASIAESAGLLQGKLQIQGVTLGAQDLMIGITVLQADYGVVTRNVRHFEMIPALRVVEL